MNVLIYGTGQGSANIEFACRRIHAEIVAYIDDNLAKHEHPFNGQSVIPVSRIFDYPYDKIIIASEAFSRQMEARLIAQGVPLENILLYPGYEEPSRSILDLSCQAGITPAKWDTLQMPITTRCNLLCAHCSRTAASRNIWTRSVEHFSALLGKFDPRVFGNLLVSGFGEVMLLSNLVDYLEAARDMGWKHVMFVTNGTCPDPGKIEPLFSRHLLSQMIVSAEAASPERYRRFRGAAVKTLRDFLGLVSGAKRKYASTTQLTLNVTCLKENLHELPDLVSLALEHALDQISFVPLTPHWLNDDAPPGKLCVPGQTLDAVRRSEVVEVFKETLRRAAGRLRLMLPEPFPELGNPGLNKRQTKERPIFRCLQPMKWVCVGQDDRVYPCCQMGEKVPMGNLEHESFHEIWCGEKYRRLLDGLRWNGEPLDVCRTCTVFNGKNF